MNFGIITLEDTSNWDYLYSILRDDMKSPFFSSAYYKSYSRVESGAVECAWAYQDERNFLFYPYVRKSVNSLGYKLDDEYDDISGAYGYNGPIGLVFDPCFDQMFNAELQNHLIRSKVVTEFVRYCPITDNRRFHIYTDQVYVLDNVFIDLSIGLEMVWQRSFEHRVRKSVRKGESYGLSTVCYRGSEITDQHLMVFYDIYNDTMQRNAADAFYFFDLIFFQSMVQNMGSMLLLSITYLAETPISTELVLIGSNLAFGFLGGTLKEYYQYKPNTFQRWELLKYLADIGIEKYSMGGGARKGDSIYDFKMSFSKYCSSHFFIGAIVHHQDVYKEICAQWAYKYPRAAGMQAGKLQGYRYQI